MAAALARAAVVRPVVGRKRRRLFLRRLAASSPSLYPSPLGPQPSSVPSPSSSSRSPSSTSLSKRKRAEVSGAAATGARSRTLTTSASCGESKPEKRVAVLPASLNSLGLKYLEADELRARFEHYDADEDGYIDEVEAVQLLIDAGVSEEDASGPASREIIHSMITTCPVESRRDGSDAVVGVSWTDFKSAVDRAAEPVSPKIYPIAGSLLLNYSGQGVTWPVLPILARSVGLAPSELGLITGASALARVLANVPASSAAERIGRKPLLVAGPMIGSLGYLGYAHGGDTLGALVASSALTGVGGALTSVGAGLYLSDVSTPLNRARTMSPLMMTALFGFAVGPALGGFLAETYDLHAPFMVTAFGMGCASASALTLLPETLRRKKRTIRRHRPTTASERDTSKAAATTTTTAAGTASATEQWMQLYRLPAMQGISAVSLMNGVLQGASPVTTVLFATEILHMSPSQLGIMFGVQILAMSAVIQPATTLSDGYRKKGKTCRSVIMLPGMAVSSVLLAAQPTLCTESMWGFAGLGALRAVSDALCIMPNVTPFIMDNTTEDRRAQALAMRNVSQDVGILLGATSLGALAQFTSVPTAMLATAGLQVAVAGFFYNRTVANREGKMERRASEAS